MSWPQHFRRLLAARNTSMGRSKFPIIRSCAKPCSTRCTRVWTSTGCASLSAGSNPATFRSPVSTRSNRHHYLMSYSLALRSPFLMRTPKPSTAGPGQCPCGVAFLSTSTRSVASTYQRSIRSGSKPNPTSAMPTSSTTYSPTWSVPGHVRSGKTSSTSSYIATER